MAHRTWKSSNRVRRRASDSSSVYSGLTDNDSSTGFDFLDNHEKEGGSNYVIIKQDAPSKKPLTASSRFRPTSLPQSLENFNPSSSLSGVYNHDVSPTEQPRHSSFLDSFMEREEEHTPSPHQSSKNHIFRSTPRGKILSFLFQWFQKYPHITREILSLDTLYSSKSKKQKQLFQYCLFSLSFVAFLMLLRSSNDNNGTSPSLTRSEYMEKNRKQKIHQILLQQHLDNGDANDPNNGAKMTTNHIGMEIPDVFQDLANVDDFPVVKGKDLPFFWHIPRSGGTTLDHVLGDCLGLKLASDAGGKGHGDDTSLEVLKLGHASYVNVDTSTVFGIKHAKDLGLASSNLADLVITSHVYEATSLFSRANRGRLFALFRHPIHRAVSLFHFVQDTHWKPNEVEELKDISIDHYFEAGKGENNWMVRFLLNDFDKDITEDDLDKAKEVLRTKCLVGLLKHKGESIDRFQKYFGWNVNGVDELDCLEKKLDWDWPMKHRHDEVQEGSNTWNFIIKKNEFDLRLYDYAEILFQEQGVFFQ